MTNAELNILNATTPRTASPTVSAAAPTSQLHLLHLWCQNSACGTSTVKATRRREVALRHSPLNSVCVFIVHLVDCLFGFFFYFLSSQLLLQHLSSFFVSSTIAPHNFCGMGLTYWVYLYMDCYSKVSMCSILSILGLLNQ